MPISAKISEYCESYNDEIYLIPSRALKRFRLELFRVNGNPLVMVTLGLAFSTLVFFEQFQLQKKK